MELNLYIAGNTYEQIAKLTNQSIGLVKSLIYKQKKQRIKQEQK